MADLDFIAPPKTATVTFALEPAYNVINSLHLLCSAKCVSGFGEWVYQTAATLSSERLRTTQVIVEALNVTGHLDNITWPSFLAWLDDLSTRDPCAMRDRELERISTKANEILGDQVSAIPTPAQLLADRAAYLSIIEDLYDRKGKTADLSLYESAHALLNDPPAMQDLMVTHLRTMWDEAVAPEWERNLPILQESAAAFESLDYSGRSAIEIVHQVIEHDLPVEWEKWLPDIEQIIFIPSAHIGPYLLLISLNDTTARIVVGTRIPKGAQVSSPALSRSELLMRLSALADDTRLHILELLAREGELCAQDIMVHLGLSQSGASRHLRQLSATGYLISRRHEGAKYYRLNHDRIDDTFDALKKFWQVD